MIQVRKRDYWTQLVDHYYDNVFVHEDPATKTIWQWFRDEYRGNLTRWDDLITFDSAKDATMFLLKWS